MKKKLLLAGTLFALLSVLAGAFGAHALKKIFPEGDLTSWETAARYQMYHSLAILFTSLFITESNRKFSSVAGLLFSMGIIFFSGSLYILTVLKAQDITVPLALSLATPFGGIMFACGWIVLAFAILKNKF